MFKRLWENFTSWLEWRFDSGVELTPQNIDSFIFRLSSLIPESAFIRTSSGLGVIKPEFKTFNIPFGGRIEITEGVIIFRESINGPGHVIYINWPG